MSVDVDRPTLPGFDPFSSEFLTDPFKDWTRAQRECPVFFYPPMNFWVVTRYDDVQAAATDWQTFSNEAVVLVPPPADLADQIPKNFFRGLVSTDPPEHTVSRKAANVGFTRPRVAAIEADIAEIANRLIDGFVDAGHCDLMDEYCYQLSLRTIARMLGLEESEEDLARYRQWTEDMFALVAPRDGAESHPMPKEEVRQRWLSLKEAIEFYEGLIEQRRESPGEDLISTLVQAKDENGAPALSDEKIVTHIQEMIGAGNDTTANLMGALVYYLSQQPEEFRELKQNPDLLENAIEEVLRRRGSAIGMYRITTRDVTISGVEIPSGEMVLLCFQATGHDAEHFPDADRFDPRRENAGDHLAFGRGRHFCMGAPLARAEARVGLQTLFERIPEIEAVADQQLDFAPALTVSMLRSLEVRWG